MLFHIKCDSNKQRVVKYYYDDGSIEAEIHVKNDRLNGPAKYYYSSGKLRELIPYVDGKLEGEGFDYYENGSLKFVRNFKDDYLHGRTIEYDENEQVINRTEYNNGKVVFNVSFYPSGDTSAIHENGRTYIYFETGKVKHVLCACDTEVFSSVQFSAAGEILKRKGSLDCLTKKDSLLLARQYPGWEEKSVE